jgi:hypothetical protein
MLRRHPDRFVPLGNASSSSIANLEDGYPRSRQAPRAALVIGVVVALVVLILVASITFSAVGFASLAPVPVPAPVEACVYSDWSAWSMQCLEYPTGEWSQVRSQSLVTPVGAVERCPDILERQACALDSCLQFNTSVYTVGCTYDPFSNLCNNSGWLLDVNWYCVTNSSLTSLESYYASQVPLGVFFFSVGVIYPCLPDCPATNASATPVPYPAPSPAPSPTPLPECDYTNITDWSDTCLEYPPGNYSQVRYEYADPPYSHCPTIEVRQNCSAYTCNEVMVIRTQVIGCGYSSETNLCTGSTRTNSTQTYCATNATNLTNYLAETGYIDGGGVLEFGLPCQPQCAVSNGTVIPPSPSPDGGSPTPSISCTYGAWSEWSSQCLEYPAGVFEQVRTRIPDEPYSFCTATSERQNCSIASCWTYDTVQISNECQYNPAGICNSSSTTTTTTTVCATNTTDYEAYDAYVGPGAVNVTTSTPVQPCVDICPPTNYSGVASPTPVPPPACTYTEWSDWSGNCYEAADGESYFQVRARLAETAYEYCTDVEETDDCAIGLGCINELIILQQPTCDDYDPYSRACLTSGMTTTRLYACLTNATNLTAYYSLPQWPSSTELTGRVTPCNSACPSYDGVPVTVPSPSPMGGPCIYTDWSAWSTSCDELSPNGDYLQYRTRPARSAACPVLVQQVPCNASNCQLISYTGTLTDCYYNSSGLCNTSENTYLVRGYCTSNATDFSDYFTNAPYVEQGGGFFTGPCPDWCASSAPPDTVVSTSNVSATTVDLSQPFVCVPPLYLNPLTYECLLCTNTSVCTKGYLDPQARVCTQVDAAYDGDKCTFDLCDEDTGVVSNPPIQGTNQYNASFQCVCDPGEENDLPAVTCTYIPPTTEPEPLPGTNCGASNSTHVCGYNEAIQQCECVSLAWPIDTTTTSFNCTAAAYDQAANTGTVVSALYLYMSSWVCPSDDGTLKVCVNDTCVGFQEATNQEHCYYDLPVINTRADDYIYTRTIYDDSRCPVTFPGRIYGICAPAACVNSLSGCAQCSSFYEQAHLVYPVGCDCCLTFADCEEFYSCVQGPEGGRCALV